MPVANNSFAPLVVDQISVIFDKDINLGLNSLHQYPPRSLAKNAEQRVIFDKPAWSRQTEVVGFVWTAF